MLVYLLMIICATLVLSVVLGEGVHGVGFSPRSDIPDDSDYAHSWKMHPEPHKPEADNPEKDA